MSFRPNSFPVWTAAIVLSVILTVILGIGRMQVWAAGHGRPESVLLQEPTASAPGLPADIELRLAFNNCTLRIRAANRQSGVSIARVQVLADDTSIYDTGDLSVVAFDEVVSLGLEPGIYRIEVRVWDTGAFAQESFSRTYRVACRAPGSTSTAVMGTTSAQSAVVAAEPPTATPTFTPTALPTATPTSTPIPTPTAIPMLTPTYTPVYVLWQPREPTPTPIPTPTLPPMPEVLRGKILFKSDRDGGEEIFVMNPDGSEVGKLTARWPYDLAARNEILSQDGQYMAFVRADFSGPQIFVHSFQYNADRQVTVMGAGASWEPAFDAGGWRIAFVSSEPDNDEIFIINRDGSGLKRLTHNEWEWDKHPSWSPDGSAIVFWSNRSGRRQIYVMSAEGKNVRRISDGYGEDWDPIWVK